MVAKGYRVVPQSLAADSGGGHGFRHVHLKEHRGAFKTAGPPAAGKAGREVVFAKGKTLFVGNVDDQGVCWTLISPRTAVDIGGEAHVLL